MTGLMDFVAFLMLAKVLRPAMFICGASAYPRIVDFAKFAEVCTEADCLFLADIALISGLVTRRCRRRRAGRLYLFLAESFVRELSKHFSRRIRIHMTHVTHNYCCCRWPHADLYNNVIYSKVIVIKDVIIFWSANVSSNHCLCHISCTSSS